MNQTSRHFRLSVALLSSGAALIALPAFAAPAEGAAAPAATASTSTVGSATPATPGAPEQLKEVVVTAQRRTENVQNVAIAVTALSGTDLQQKQVMRELDLQNASPGLTITKAGLTESINIRGIGLASGSPQVTNGVATYIDGIFQPPIVSSGEFYDMGEAEVLRGPQGTLVGANSTGGAIYLNTNKPVLGNYAGNISTWGGSYNHYGATAAVNLPLGDTLALRVAGLFDTRDSYYTNLGPAQASPDRLSEHDGRIELLWKPVSQFQATLKAEEINKATGGYAYQPIPVAPLQYAAGATGKPWTVSYDTPTDNNERATLSSLELKYSLPDGTTLRSVTGFTEKNVHNLYDSDGASLPITAATPQSVQYQFVREREYSEELNLISPDTGAFKYVLGGYVQRNVINVRIDSSTLSTPGGSPSNTYIQPDTDKLLAGVFGQGTYQLTDKLSIDAGLRYSHFNVTGSGGVYAGVPAAVCTGALHDTYAALGCDVSPQTGTENDGQMTGKLSLNYKFDPDNLLYAFVARGYKNGGINPPGGTFNPETVWDYEGGWKSTFLDHHLRTQIGVYYNNYANFQEDVVGPQSGQSAVANLASATIYGFEASGQGRWGAFSLDAGLAYTHSSMSAFTAINRELTPAGVSSPQCSPAGVAGTSGAGCFNYYYFTTSGGNPNLLSPEWTGNINASYKFELEGDMTLTPRVTYSYVGSQWDYVTYNPRTDLIRAHDLFDASATLVKGNVSLEVYGSNLANNYYVAGRSGNNLLFGAPREFGARLNLSF